MLTTANSSILYYIFIVSGCLFTLCPLSGNAQVREETIREEAIVSQTPVSDGVSFETLRSPVSGLRGVVATSQPLAANAGLDVLKKGGNAIDAAVATAAVLTVVEPMATGLGGDAFIMIYLAGEHKLIGLNASGRSPYAATLDKLNGKVDRRYGIRGIYSVTVPGAVDGWFKVLEKYGTMTMAEVLEPAIYYAEHGFPVSEIIAREWKFAERFKEHSTRETWLIEGNRAPRAGEIFINKDLANTLKILAKKGRDVFYKGELAGAIVKYSDSHDGLLAMKDFEDHTSTWVEPIYVDYRNYRLYELPPNGQGIAALEMLKILENVDLKSMGHNSAEYMHYLVEAKKLAYADILKWNADPDFNDLPVDQMISSGYAKEQFARINQVKAMENPVSGIDFSGDTVLIEVMDKDNNAVSFIQSLFSSFGSKLVVPGTGITLQNRGNLFSRDPGHVNVIEPHKRPFHTIIPAMAFRDGEPFMTFGVMGGSVQPQQHVQVFLNTVEFGMNMQQAVEVPRINHGGRLTVIVEPGIDEAELGKLESWGHNLVRRRSKGGVGGAQGIMFDSNTKVMTGGSTPHKDGMAVAY